MCRPSDFPPYPDPRTEAPDDLEELEAAASILDRALESPEMPGPGYDAQTRPIPPLYEGPRCASCGGDHFPPRGTHPPATDSWGRPVVTVLGRLGEVLGFRRPDRDGAIVPDIDSAYTERGTDPRRKE